VTKNVVLPNDEIPPIAVFGKPPFSGNPAPYGIPPSPSVGAISTLALGCRYPSCR
jgi:hypothetical protein